MILQIEIPDSAPKALVWYLVRYVLQGFALGCRPYFVGPNALPPLHCTKIRYAFDGVHGSGVERIVTPDVVLARGYGDCNDLVNYEVARRQAEGGPDSVAVADWLGNGEMHAQIRRADGQIEDPSIAYGAPVDWPAKYLYNLEG